MIYNLPLRAAGRHRYHPHIIISGEGYQRASIQSSSHLFEQAKTLKRTAAHTRHACARAAYPFAARRATPAHTLYKRMAPLERSGMRVTLCLLRALPCLLTCCCFVPRKATALPPAHKHFCVCGEKLLLLCALYFRRRDWRRACYTAWRRTPQAIPPACACAPADGERKRRTHLYRRQRQKQKEPFLRVKALGVGSAGAVTCRL